eukprot:CAMPEP_0197466756 /NCGR_PEP_ID=MMETSP1175-20131217/65217_1 /TAXON_ID=1003142 /ORGANISM="Triceratium dubium, Strain CCMP147" /LENGTH=476 /DNA_ID=CAMNT_0043002809 /DNA_START=153 /DNA_END=1583 /DNA_ORIENTATION=-
MIYWTIARQFVLITHIVPVLSALAVWICLSCGLIIGSIFKLTLICGGTGTRGSAVGVAKGFVGLGSGVYACIFQALQTTGESALDFLPVIAFFFIVCTTLPASILLPTKDKADTCIIKSESTPLHFRTMYVSLLLLGTVIVGTSLIELLNENDTSEGRRERDYKKVLMILAIWLGPIASLLFLPRQQEGHLLMNSESIPVANNIHNDEILPPDEALRTEGEKKALLSKHQQSYMPKASFVEEPKDLNLLQMLQTPSAWLMLWTTSILVGSGTYKTNNMGEMVDSLGFPKAVTPATIALFSVAQALARVVTGVVSEATLNWRNVHSCCVHYGIPRPFHLLVASSIAVLAHLLLAFSTSQVWFVLASTISGISFGMVWPLMVLIVGEIFGVTNHGQNYMFYDGFSKAVGTIFLSGYVAGTVYEEHAEPDDPLTCYGTACFQKTHLLVAAFALTGAAASLALQFTSRHAYMRINEIHTP